MWCAVTVIVLYTPSPFHILVKVFVWIKNIRFPCTFNTTLYTYTFPSIGFCIVLKKRTGIFFVLHCIKPLPVVYSTYMPCFVHKFHNPFLLSLSCVGHCQTEEGRVNRGGRSGMRHRPFLMVNRSRWLLSSGAFVQMCYYIRSHLKRRIVM